MVAEAQRHRGREGPESHREADGHREGAARARRRRLSRARWRSPLGRRILLLNTLVLLIPILGLLHLEDYRDGLIEAEAQSLTTQARAYAFALAGGAVVVAPNGEQRLVGDQAARITRLLLGDSKVRARIFVQSGELVADSFRFSNLTGGIEIYELPPPGGEGGLRGWLSALYDRALQLFAVAVDLPLYRENDRQKASDYEEVERALQGASNAVARRDGRGGLVISVAVPLQRYRQVLAALMLSKDGSDIQAAVQDRRGDILLVFGIALCVTVLLSFYLTGTIARPIRRLAEAADLVRRSKNRQVALPDLSHRRDEIGDLSEALRDMTEALWNRMDAIERFAADVSHEIKNPLTSVRSAVETVALVDDPAQQKKLMAIILDDVARLDRLISDISNASRLDAELSRAETEPVELRNLLAAVVDSYAASGKTEWPSFRLEIPDDDKPLVVSGIEDRLGQVFRNLITNAISFSPPQGEVRLTLSREDGQALVAVEDSGPGIPEGKLAAIFDRFYSERPKGEKFGAHSGLGLSISKQIVEAHGGAIWAENRQDDAGRIEGARFVVRLPLE
ncbi:stimulus-sensing domain-containing protein [Limibacillus halophilus]